MARGVGRAVVRFWEKNEGQENRISSWAGYGGVRERTVTHDSEVYEKSNCKEALGTVGND